MFKDFTHHAYQFAFFTDGADIPPDEFNVACRKRLNIGKFNPSFVPEFPGMPDEIPRLQIQSEAGYIISLSKVRVDVIIDRAYGLSDEDRAQFKANIMTLIGILEEYDFKASRVGLVKRYLKVMENPSRFVSNLFGGRGSERFVDFGVNAVQRTELLARQCNDIFNITSGVIRGAEPGVVAFRDITVVPGQGIIEPDEIKEFIPLADGALSMDSLASLVGGA